MMNEAHEQVEEQMYEAPAIEPIGDADELAKGNEGSPTDGAGPV